MTNLKSIVSRIERIREEKKALTGDEREVFSEAKSDGYDVKVLRRVLQRRAAGGAACDEFDTLVAMYENELGGKAIARDAIKAGATVREAAKKAGISVGAAQAQRSKINIPEHDPDTGEISEPPAGASSQHATDSDPVAAAPSPAAVPAGDPAIGPQTIKMIAAIADNPVSDEVARIAIQTAQLADAGQLRAADAIVKVVKAADDFDAARDIPAYLRREKPAVLA